VEKHFSAGSRENSVAVDTRPLMGAFQKVKKKETENPCRPRLEWLAALRGDGRQRRVAGLLIPF